MKKGFLISNKCGDNTFLLTSPEQLRKFEEPMFVEFSVGLLSSENPSLFNQLVSAFGTVPLELRYHPTNKIVYVEVEIKGVVFNLMVNNGLPNSQYPHVTTPKFTLIYDNLLEQLPTGENQFSFDVNGFQCRLMFNRGVFEFKGGLDSNTKDKTKSVYEVLRSLHVYTELHSDTIKPEEMCHILFNGRSFTIARKLIPAIEFVTGEGYTKDKSNPAEKFLNEFQTLLDRDLMEDSAKLAKVISETASEIEKYKPMVPTFLMLVRGMSHSMFDEPEKDSFYYYQNVGDHVYNRYLINGSVEQFIREKALPKPVVVSTVEQAVRYGRNKFNVFDAFVFNTKDERLIEEFEKPNKISRID